jgi:uncharacterized membrane protein
LLLKARWLAIAIPASIVAAYAGVVLLLPSFGAPFIRERLAEMPVAVLGHVSGGAVALFVGAFQMNAGLRARFLQIHRWLGRVYVVAVLVGGLGGLGMATRSQGGLVTHIGFGLLAVLWLATTAAAYRQIRRGDQANHRRWMLRSYALTFAAVMLRVYLPIALAAGVPFIDAYQAIAWACWVPNLLVVEWWLLRPVRAKSAYVAA